MADSFLTRWVRLFCFGQAENWSLTLPTWRNFALIDLKLRVFAKKALVSTGVCELFEENPFRFFGYLIAIATDQILNQVRSQVCLRWAFLYLHSLFHCHFPVFFFDLNEINIIPKISKKSRKKNKSYFDDIRW